jgi:hypothetical protein
MDGQEFDRRLRSLHRSLDRRRGLASVLGLTAAALSGALSAPPQAEAKPRSRKPVHVAGPCGDSGPHANRCQKNSDCCSNDCNKKAGRKYGRCRTPSPPPPCTALGDSCAPGADPCCTNVNPNATCGSTFAGISPANWTCQDCAQPPTAAGAYCQTPNGNQCCGGQAHCFVGVRVDNGQPDCFADGTCTSGAACTGSTGCSGGQVCAQASSGCGCSTGTFCGTLCGGAN